MKGWEMRWETERKKTFDKESKGNYAMLPCQRNGMGVQLISMGVLQWNVKWNEFHLFGIDHGPQLQYMNLKYMHVNKNGIKCKNYH